VRQYPVTIHFSRRTASDYVTESVKKASKIHSRLPPGGILIFLTGQNEITGVCRKLEAKYGQKALDEKRRGRSVQRNVGVVAPDNSQESDSRVMPVQGQRQILVISISHFTDPVLADIEAEDVDLGGQDDLAFDVDDNMADGDSEALDSDDERDMDDALGLDEDEIDCKLLSLLWSLIFHNDMG
jgi:ATP-dependent RNA helicase DHX37/DHR1